MRGRNEYKFWHPWNFFPSVSWLKLPQWENVDPCFLMAGTVLLWDFWLTNMEEITELLVLEETSGDHLVQLPASVFASLHNTFQWIGYLTWSQEAWIMLLALLTVLALGIFQESIVLLTGIKIHSEIVLSTGSSDDCGRCCHARLKLFPKVVKQKTP